MQINLQNVEKLFKNKHIHDLLPEFKHLFDSWIMSQRMPALRNLGKRSLVDFINSLEQNHLVILEEYFGEDITLDKLDYHIVRNIETTLSELTTALAGCEDFLDLAIYRNQDHFYISVWR